MESTDSIWRGRPVLVTGAGGFIGSHLAERLCALGARVRALVHYRGDGGLGWLAESPMRKEMDIVAGDVTDEDCAERAVAGCSTVFHLAALIAIPYSYAAPRAYVRTNVLGTGNLLAASLRHGVGCFVQTSTSEVYGTARTVPIDEQHPLQGQSPYAASKIGADALAISYHRAFDLPVVVLRPFNTYGPRQSARAVIPTCILQCLDGDRVRLGAVHPTRDLTYVDDTVAGFLAAARAPSCIGETVNLGTGHEIAIGELARRIGRMLGREIEIDCEAARLRPAASEVERLLSSYEKMHSLSGWAPTVDLDAGLARTIAWVRAHRDRFQQGDFHR